MEAESKTPVGQELESTVGMGAADDGGARGRAAPGQERALGMGLAPSLCSR